MCPLEFRLTLISRNKVPEKHVAVQRSHAHVKDEHNIGGREGEKGDVYPQIFH